jgi:hypothetical protein
VFTVSEETLAERWAVEFPSDLESLDDEALCQAWRRSFLLLQAAATANGHMSIVRQRERFLDELSRRSPQGFAAWLTSGARAAGNPLPYLGDQRRKAA